MEGAKLPASPGTPLFPLSPERVNGARLPHSSTMQSPPEFGKPSMTVDPFNLSLKGNKSPFRHSRNNSDAMVHGMIARFDNMSIKDYKLNHENAIKRVEIAREMAEIENKKLKEELNSKDEETRKSKEDNRKLKKELEDSKDRERKVSRRLEVVMEELHRAKETHTHTVAVYEKEIRKTRKEAFKSSSGLLKTQEELKSVRSTFKMTQANYESTKLKLAKYEQEAFTAQYQLVGVQEELQKAMERVKVLEEEGSALKQSLQTEEVARIAAEGRIALPAAAEDDEMDLLASPAKSPRKASPSSDSEKENVPKKTVQLKSLQEELTYERRMRQKAQDQVDFMKMECQFQCCSCRIAEKSGGVYIHDGELLPEMERIKNSITYPEPTPEVDMMDEDLEISEHSTPKAKVISMEDDLRDASLLRSTPTMLEDIAEKPQLGPEASSHYTGSSHAVHQSNAAENEDVADDEEEPESPVKPAELYSEPATPEARAYRTVTTTTTVPMMFSPVKAPLQPISVNACSIPETPKTISHSNQYKLESTSPFPSKALKEDGTIDREAALELIRQRRGRARSVAMGQATPKKQMVQGNVRRDISAPSMKTC